MMKSRRGHTASTTPAPHRPAPYTSAQPHDDVHEAGTTLPVVEVRDLRVARGGKEIIHGLDLTLDPGTVTGLLGPSGCGKTTLMRTLVGVQRYRGRVTVLGAEPGRPAVRARVSHMTQGASVYRDLTGRQNVSYFARLAGTRARNVEEVMSDVGLSDLIDRPVSTYSGGEANRVSLACALVADPDLLVMDEPTVGLDPLTREDLWRTFQDMARRGTTILVSSHVMDEAFRCDRVLLMRDGHLLASTTAADLLAETGEPTIDAAFLAVIIRARSAPAPGAPGTPVEASR